MTAAVVEQFPAPLETRELRIPDPGQVLVRNSDLVSGMIAARVVFQP